MRRGIYKCCLATIYKRNMLQRASVEFKLKMVRYTVKTSSHTKEKRQRKILYMSPRFRPIWRRETYFGETHYMCATVILKFHIISYNDKLQIIWLCRISFVVCWERFLNSCLTSVHFRGQHIAHQEGCVCNNIHSKSCP